MPKRNTTDKIDTDGSGSYSYDAAKEIPSSLEDKYRFIPVSLMTKEFFAAAQSCAVAYNDADDLGRSCSVGEGILRGAQLTAAGLAVLSAGMSGRVTNDAVKRHWDYAALASTGALGALVGFDAWLNCSERTWTQKQLSSERLAKLNNAGRLATCGAQLVDFENKRKNAQDAVATLKAHGAAAGPGVSEAEKVLADSSRSPDEVFQVAQALSATRGPLPVAGIADDAALQKINSDRAKASAAITAIAPLQAQICRDVAKAAEGESRPLRAADYADAAHKELIECLTPRFTTFSNSAVGSTGSP